MDMRRAKPAASFVMEDTDDVVKAERSNVSTDEEIRKEEQEWEEKICRVRL